MCIRDSIYIYVDEPSSVICIYINVQIQKKQNEIKSVHVRKLAFQIVSKIDPSKDQVSYNSFERGDQHPV